MHLNVEPHQQLARHRFALAKGVREPAHQGSNIAEPLSETSLLPF
ncbi:hypothetical protein [Corallococcus sp. CA047B]|nr:hypothetical protein [Corallococcus sp. CA047B]